MNDLKPDALDYAVLALLLVVLLIAMPIAVGRAWTPHRDGKPLLLHGNTVREMRYIAQARELLEVCRETHAKLEHLPRGDTFSASAEMQALVERTDRAWTEWEQVTPPGRFAGLHEQLLALVKLYRYLAGEAWAYYGDLDETHLGEVERGLGEGKAETERLGELLDRLDFERAGAGGGEGGQPGRGKPTPTPEHLLPEWGEGGGA